MEKKRCLYDTHTHLVMGFKGCLLNLDLSTLRILSLMRNSTIYTRVTYSDVLA
jgi:hypothetical protein